MYVYGDRWVEYKKCAVGKFKEEEEEYEYEDEDEDEDEDENENEDEDEDEEGMENSMDTLHGCNKLDAALLVFDVSVLRCGRGRGNRLKHK
jgi:hypothetical protein